ncbi:MAG: gluconeogenesis factor YvcK family protein [Pseudomonadota bacterium]
MTASAHDQPAHDQPRVVTFGGGTGLATLLAGLKDKTPNVTAIVTVADDGGSSGRLRQDMGMIPPGDIRSCLEALAGDELMRRLFDYRFEEGPLDGHSMGNLIMAALTRVTGDFEQAVEHAARMLNAAGRVIPSSTQMVSLRAETGDGATVEGQHNISCSGGSCRRVWLEPAAPSATTAAVEAIDSADLLVLGPGSLFTSVIPNLLIPDINDAVHRSAAPCLFVCNVMTQPGETLGFSVADHAAALVDHIGEGTFDTVLANTSEPTPDIIEAYGREGAAPVTVDEDRVAGLGLRLLLADVGFANDHFRHDSRRLAAAVMSLLTVHNPLGDGGSQD